MEVIINGNKYIPADSLGSANDIFIKAQKEFYDTIIEILDDEIAEYKELIKDSKDSGLDLIRLKREGNLESLMIFKNDIKQHEPIAFFEKVI